MKNRNKLRSLLLHPVKENRELGLQLCGVEGLEDWIQSTPKFADEMAWKAPDILVQLSQPSRQLGRAAWRIFEEMGNRVTYKKHKEFKKRLAPIWTMKWYLHQLDFQLTKGIRIEMEGTVPKFTVSWHDGQFPGVDAFWWQGSRRSCMTENTKRVLWEQMVISEDPSHVEKRIWLDKMIKNALKPKKV